MDAILAASQICDEYGIDNMTAGVTVGFAMECFERGLIGPEDTGGIRSTFRQSRGPHSCLLYTSPSPRD